MDVLKKPLVACLISILLIGLSTGYMFLFESEEVNVQNEPTDEFVDTEDEGIFGDLQEGIVEEIRTQIAEKVANYDGDIIIVSNANAAVAPNLSTFIPTPTIIYNTLGSENGFMGTYMVVEGEVIEWITFENLTQLILSNADGEIQLLIGEPLVNNPLSFYQRTLSVGTNVRIYFYYSGFSLVFERAAGIAIGFVVLETLP